MTFKIEKILKKEKLVEKNCIKKDLIKSVLNQKIVFEEKNKKWVILT